MCHLGQLPIFREILWKYQRNFTNILIVTETINLHPIKSLLHSESKIRLGNIFWGNKIIVPNNFYIILYDANSNVPIHGLLNVFLK